MSAAAARVIALCGRPGSGKSTLAASLAERISAARRLDWDDFETFTRCSPAEVRDWLDRGGDPAEVAAPGLAEAIAAARRLGPVILEAPFGRTHPATGGLIDIAVWIDVPADLALARKLRQILGAGKDPAPARNWLAGYLGAYETIVRPACDLQAIRVPPTCDLSVSGEDPVPVSVARILEFSEPGPG